MEMPVRGCSKAEILETLRDYREQDLQWRQGRVFAYVFDPGKETEEVATEALELFLNDNALDPTTFPSLLRMEREVVHMIADLLRADEQVVGNFTSGGTESILLAVKTARDKMRAERPEITKPEMVLPRTAHSAFHKACHYFDVKPVVVGFDRGTFQADVDAMRKAITPNTILLVASAPGYAQGVVDPVREIGALALERDLLFHVDACVGGIQLSLMREMGGYDLPDFDFSVPGVTSISADMHKYGYSPKGASVILYRNKDLRKYQIFSTAASTIYALVNPTILSTKSGGPLAGAWATLKFLGKEGYQRMIVEVMDATRRMMDGVNATGDLHVLGQPHISMFSMASDTINVFQLADEMHALGWYIQPQLSTEWSPSNLHITMHYGTVHVVEPFLADLRQCLERVKAHPLGIDPAVLKSQLEPMLANLSPEAFQQVLAMGGVSGSGAPQNMALINSVLDVLPDEIAAELLTRFMNEMLA